jgi:signal transduction histidine kinase
LRVKDEGPGIRDEEKSRIFSKFYRVGDESTRKTKGTGLGLYICRKIAQAHKGEISVTDNIPHGSIFKVIFRT